ncbi:hypothetical protein QNI19_03165 [Cytophagaceae bacterium DM2B3-1]|uniref:DUF4468 domain-containing protein n=1 Tax=Xanthocytophaga flava TaxID=3048013 RepID=A0ABT7CFS2_9BACT|nr:hypothetical protein [Xanthocytophaga flavus]MDJ1491917.1 hypothetical protein [Xanthocytophaga flavus]
MKYLLFFLLLPACAIAQQDEVNKGEQKSVPDSIIQKWMPPKGVICEYLKNEKDEFTGKQIIEAGTDYFSVGLNGSYLYLKYQLNDLFTSDLGRLYVIDQGSTFYLKLDNGAVMNLTVAKVKNSKSGNIIIYCPLTEDQLTVLANRTAVRYRIELDVDNHDGDVIQRQGNKMKQGAQCLKMYLDYEHYKAAKK